MKYGNGDVVTVVAPIPKDWNSYVGMLDRYVGKSGVVTDYSLDISSDQERFPGGAYAVKFAKPAAGDSCRSEDGSAIWWFPALVLERDFDTSLRATGDLQSLFRRKL